MVESVYALEEGTLRSASPDATLRRILPWCEHFGITRIADITGLDHIGIPTVIAVRPHAKHLSVSMGKGANLTLAKVSAVMESIETYHAENPSPPVAHGTYLTLQRKGYPVVAPFRFPRGFFCQPAWADYAVDWKVAIRLPDQTEHWIPHALVNLDASEMRPEYAYWHVSTNGLASGNTLEEALCHGLYEVIERDALAAWPRMAREIKQGRQVDLATVDDSLCRHLLDCYRDSGMMVWVWDIASLPIPTFHCALTDANPFRVPGIFRGSGSHWLPSIALARALLEAAQSRLSLISGSRDDLFASHYRKSVGEKISLPTDSGSKDFASCYQRPLPPTFSQQLNNLLAIVAASGIAEVYYVDHTRPPSSIAVVHVFAPGCGVPSS